MPKHDMLYFIGGGNMASSLIGGLIAQNYAASNIHVAEPDELKRQMLTRRFPGITTTAGNAQTAEKAACIILAVKPQSMEQVLSTLNKIETRALFLSVAAGITSRQISSWLGGHPAIVRAMPNTPALIGCGATGAFANEQVSPAQKHLAESILKAAGLLHWFEEENALNAVTALSGSGPAYIFRFIEALEAGGVELGLPQDVARELAVQTAYGASRLALEKNIPPSELRAQVTSPGGTTEKAIDVFNQDGLDELVSRAMGAAAARAQELAGD